MLNRADAENDINEELQRLLQELNNLQLKSQSVFAQAKEAIKPFKNGVKLNIARENQAASAQFFESVKTRNKAYDAINEEFRSGESKVAEIVDQMQMVCQHFTWLRNARDVLQEACRKGVDNFELDEKMEAMHKANDQFKQECRILKSKLPFPSYDSFKNTLLSEIAKLAEIQPVEGITDDFSVVYAAISEIPALLLRKMEICSAIREIRIVSLKEIQEGAKLISTSCAFLLIEIEKKAGTTAAEFKAAISPDVALGWQEVARKAGANIDEGKGDPSSSAGSSQQTSDEPSAPFGHHETSAEPSAPHIPHKTTLKPSTPPKHHETSAEPSAPHISHKTPAKPSALPKHHETSHEPSAPLSSHETSAEPSAPLEPHASFATASTPSRTGSEHSDSENRHSPSNSVNGSSDGGSPAAKPKKGAPSTTGTFSNSANAAKLAAEQNALVAETREKRKRCVML